VGRRWKRVSVSSHCLCHRGSLPAKSARINTNTKLILRSFTATWPSKAPSPVRSGSLFVTLLSGYSRGSTTNWSRGPTTIHGRTTKSSPGSASTTTPSPAPSHPHTSTTRHYMTLRSRYQLFKVISMYRSDWRTSLSRSVIRQRLGGALWDR